MFEFLESNGLGPRCADVRQAARRARAYLWFWKPKGISVDLVCDVDSEPLDNANDSMRVSEHEYRGQIACWSRRGNTQRQGRAGDRLNQWDRSPHRPRSCRLTATPQGNVLLCARNLVPQKHTRRKPFLILGMVLVGIPVL
jgi:hypothetical protein